MKGVVLLTLCSSSKFTSIMSLQRWSSSSISRDKACTRNEGVLLGQRCLSRCVFATCGEKEVSYFVLLLPRSFPLKLLRDISEVFEELCQFFQNFFIDVVLCCSNFVFQTKSS